jgi:hypothetical protein
MLQRLVTRLLAGAVARWPADLREDLAREWAAELHALEHEAGAAAPLRRWRQLRFAASLAAARPPGGQAVARYWLRQASPAGAQAAWLLSAPVLATLAAALTWVPLLLLPFGWIPYTPTSLAFFALEGYAIQAGLAGLVGTLLARRFLRRRSGHPVGVAGCAWAALPVAGGLIAVDLLARAADQMWEGNWSAVIAALCLVVLLPPVAAAVAALAGRGRRGRAVALAGLAAPVLSLTATYAVVLLAPQTPAAAARDRWWWLAYLYREPPLPLTYSPDGRLPVETILPVLPGFVLTTVVLALAYAIRLARPLPATLASAPAAAPARRDPATIPTLTGSPWWHRTALAGAAYAVIAWAVTLTYLTPNIGVQNSWPSRVAGTEGGGALPAQPAGWPGWSTEEGRVWMHELQLSGIVCAALCLLLAGAYRGRPLLPALAGSVVLLAGNMVVVRQDWITPRLLPWLAAAGLLLGAATWRATIRRGTARAPRPRRLVIAITMLAAFLVPGSFFPRFYVPDGVPAPPLLLLVAVGLPAILTVLTGMGVLATSRRPPRGPAWRLPAGLTLLVAVGGVLFYQDGLFRLLPAGDNPLAIVIFAAPIALAVPVTVWTAAAIRARPRSARRLGLRVLATPLLFAAGYPLAMATALVGSTLARAVLFPMEYGRAYDGLPYVPGAIVVGLLVGWLTALRLDHPRPEPAPATATDGFIDLGYAHPGPA